MTTTTTNFKSLDGPSHATVFIWLFAISSIWHYTSSASDIASYWFQYNPLVTPLIFISIGTGFLAACFPDKTRALLWLSIGQLAAIGLRFPFVADHRVMEMFLSLSIVLSYCYLAFGKQAQVFSETKVGFTARESIFVEPSSRPKYLGKVVLLTGRHSASAAETGRHSNYSTGFT